MAKWIASPGVVRRELDLSFLPAGIAAIGACIIGPTVKGPAFVPTQVSNFSEFEEIFGSTDSKFYTPYAAEQYLSSAGTVTIVRVLNVGGYAADLVQVNQMLKYIKFGFGQCMDHACYDFRDGRLSRKKSIELVKKYDGKCSEKYINEFCNFIEITIDEFWETANKFRGKMWVKKSNGEWYNTYWDNIII